jgi:hypothetical protein
MRLPSRFRLNARPILVTGANRSGTTWVGRVIASANNVRYVHEPFNHQHLDPERHLITPPFAHHYHYVEQGEARHVKRYLQYRMGQRHPWLTDVSEQPGFRRIAGATRRWIDSIAHTRCRPLVKDPIALMSAEWLAHTFGMQVVVTIRHPAAYVSSILRLNWPMRPHVFISQPALMKGFLAPLAEQITAQHRRENDPVGDAILAWNVFHHVIALFQKRHPDWLFLRHEDLSRDYLTRFQEMFTWLDLSFGPHQKRLLETLCGSSNPAEAHGRVHQLKRDSQANIWNWKKRLGTAEIRRIREESADVAPLFYSVADW